MSSTAPQTAQHAGVRFEPAMRRALELARNGPAWGPNPQVGCVLLDRSGQPLAEGWHRGAGTAHAEVDALSKLPLGGAIGATAVVVLEPCNHIGRTGPCSEALLFAGVERVVYATSDPDAHAAGGARRLAEAGVEVIGGVLVEEVEAVLHRWLTAVRLGRPHITLKWASSLDGRAAATDGSSRWITGNEARLDVHLRRADSAAILVGTGTLLADDPSLTARDARGDLLPHQPTPVVVGRRRIPSAAAILAHPQPVLQISGEDLAGQLSDLFSRGITTAFVEGGPTLASALVRADLVDEYLIYLAPLLLGGDRMSILDAGVPSLADAHQLRLTSTQRLGEDILVIARPTTNEFAEASPALPAEG